VMTNSALVESVSGVRETVASESGCLAEESITSPFTDPLGLGWAADRIQRNRKGKSSRTRVLLISVKLYIIGENRGPD
jgi:hypothetical protein